MAKGLFVKGYMAFLRRFLYGFTELDPSRSRKKKKRLRIRKRRHKTVVPSPGPFPRVRVRTVSHPKKLGLKVGSWWRLIGTSWQKHFDVTVDLTSPYKSIEHTQDLKNSGPPYRTGGPFTCVKVDLQPFTVGGIGNYASPTTLNFGDGAFFRQYRGGFSAPDFTGVDFNDSQYADVKFVIGNASGFVPPMSPYHSLVDKRLRPKLSHANLGQSLAEIREIPGMLQNSARDFSDYWKFVGGSSSSKRMGPKGASDSFLNAQFGWAPFIRDIADVCDVVVNADRYIRDTTNRNNRWDHRESVLHEETVDSILSTGTGSRVSPNTFQIDQLLQSTGGWTKRFQFSKRESHRVWASGDYKFYKPAFDMSLSDYDSGWNQIRRLSTILGTDISPSLLYKITPWTWLLDWMTNVGNVIETASAAGLDGVVSKNVFLMYSFSREIVLLQELNMIGRPIAFEFRRMVSSKQRGHALTPYNFSLLPTQLSAKQWSILGALGISKFT